MWRPRFERFLRLLERRARPGGMYPVLKLARADVAADERAAMLASVRETALAAAVAVWSDPASTVGARALAVAALDPDHAAIHCALADIVLRCDDAHVEPFPELSRALSAPYVAVRAQLIHDADQDSEMYATRRGLMYWLREVEPIFKTAEAQQCFARGASAWGAFSPLGGLTDAECAEHQLTHTPAGVSAAMTGPSFGALEAPEELTSLMLSHPIAAGLPVLARATNVRSLSLYARELPVPPDLAAVPVETLALQSVAAKTGLPAWVDALPALRSLIIWFDDAKPNAVLELPGTLQHLTKLESLKVGDVKALPHDVGRLVGLRELELRGWSFDALPASIAELPRLEKLKVNPSAALQDLPEGFERLTSLRDLELGQLITPGVPRVLFKMPWLRRVYLVAAADWPPSEEAALKAALPDAKVTVAFTGPVLRARAARPT